MTPTELQAALHTFHNCDVDYLRATKDSEDGEPVDASREFMAAVETIVRHVESETDQTPVDAAWLEQVLGPKAKTAAECGDVYWYTMRGGSLHLAWKMRQGFVSSRVDGRARSEILGLLRWLRIEVKEPHVKT